MEIQELETGRVTVLVINGRVDSSNAIDLGNKIRALYATPGRRLLLDLEEMDYISSAGFRTLLIALRRAADTGGRLALCCLTSKVRDLFEMGGFLDNFDIKSAREEGVSSLA
jgi:anti-sigma B factor antagonist